MARRSFAWPLVCERCGATVDGRGHRHRVTVRVPIERVVNGVTCDSFERVTVVADYAWPAAAIARAVRRVHGRAAHYWSEAGRVYRREGGAFTVAPVIEWDGGDL